MEPWDESELTKVLAGAVALSLVAVLVIGLTTTATSEPHTEFYVLNDTGAASGYPTNLSVNETGTVQVGLANHEGTAVTYTIVLRFDDERIASRTVTVQPEESWRQEFSVTPQTDGTHRLDILLYKRETGAAPNEADQQLRLWIDAANESTDSIADESSLAQRDARSDP